MPFSPGIIAGLLMFLTAALLPGIQIQAQAEEYNPLETFCSVISGKEVLSDPLRQRDIPIRFYQPDSSGPHPVVFFSHGLGGSRDNNRYLGEHFAGRGYVCIFLQHPGSDESVWQGKRPLQIMPALQKAANFENLKLRCADVRFVVQQLPVWNQTQGHALCGQLDLNRIGMSGHSFGAQTTQAVLGQNYLQLRPSFLVPEFRAGIAYSPSVPLIGEATSAFRSINRPMLLMTGTRDDAPVGGQTPESRRLVYPALPDSIDRYELVLQEARHSAFGERGARQNAAGSDERNPNHHRVILALSTAFWDTYLKDNPTAKSWLQGQAPRHILEEADQWQFSTKSK